MPHTSPRRIDSDVGSAYAWYVVVVLQIALIFSFMDRQILSLLVEPIRHDLQISDTQISLLQGASFAIFYTLMGFPIGWMVDQRNRRNIIAVGVTLWSLMTALCGITQSYLQLLLARVGVAVGEASVGPSAYSLISDYFPPNRRATAIGVFSLGIFFGSGLAMVAGGFIIKWVDEVDLHGLPLIGDLFPWQLVFVFVGLPGLLVTVLMLLTVREPPRRGAALEAGGDHHLHAHHAPIAPVAIKEALAYLRHNRRTFFHHNVGFALIALVGYGASAWVPTFFVRTYGWSLGDAGIYFGGTVVLFGTLGVVIGGWLADTITHKGWRDGKMVVGLIAACGGFPSAILFPLVNDPFLALALSAPSVFVASFSFSAGPAALAEFVPNQMRGQAAALYLFVVNMIGLGTGPTAIAMVTDYVFADDKALPYSIAIVAGCALPLSALTFWFGRKHYVRTVEELPTWKVRLAAEEAAANGDDKDASDRDTVARVMLSE